MAKPRTPNTPIGTCPCAFKGCDQVGDVYKFRARTDDPSRQRHAGRLYMRCQVHGMIQDQDWILEHATIDPEHAVENREIPLSDETELEASDPRSEISPQQEKIDPGKGAESPPARSPDPDPDPQDTDWFL